MENTIDVSKIDLSFFNPIIQIAKEKEILKSDAKLIFDFLITEIDSSANHPNKPIALALFRKISDSL